MEATCAVEVAGAVGTIDVANRVNETDVAGAVERKKLGGHVSKISVMCQATGNRKPEQILV